LLKNRSVTTFKCILRDGTTRTVFVKDSHFDRPGASLSKSPSCGIGQALLAEKPEEDEDREKEGEVFLRVVETSHPGYDDD
jgi:hypothetical protein